MGVRVVSACDGSGRAIGCPGCQECRREMAEIDAVTAELFGLVRQLSSSPRRGRTATPAPAPDPARARKPWTQTHVEEPAW